MKSQPHYIVVGDEQTPLCQMPPKFWQNAERDYESTLAHPHLKLSCSWSTKGKATRVVRELRKHEYDVRIVRGGCPAAFARRFSS